MLQKLVQKVCESFFQKNSQKDRLLKFLFKCLSRDPLIFAYNNMGILNYQNSIISGERNLIKNVLPEYFSLKNRNIFFDVGANSGRYSIDLASTFPESKVYSFEPNKNSFKKLKSNVGNFKNIKPFQVGFSDKNTESVLYTYTNELDSEHASIYENVLIDLHSSKNVSAMSIDLMRLDEFCQIHNIKFIDFLKIDTEGNELDVLNGALKMINAGRIKVIQFEFNEMNIISRVFLKDFYNLLSNYKIYRLMENHIDPIINYNSVNEIFKFQNLVAIHRNV